MMRHWFLLATAVLAADGGGRNRGDARALAGARVEEG
jgi:hypothetical protein